MKSSRNATPQQRILAHICVDELTGCWHWSASLDRQGYGQVMVRGKLHRAHRYSFEAFVGPVQNGLELDHVCHSKDLSCNGGKSCAHRKCVNPNHLEPVTRKENAERGRAGLVHKQRMAEKNHCKIGHEFSPQNTWVSKAGARHCRECSRLRVVGAPRVRNTIYGDAPPRTHCKNGHDWKPENLSTHKGKPCCRICRNAQGGKVKCQPFHKSLGLVTS